MSKNYIGISRDHSGSMASIARAAARDYNSTITSIQQESVTAGLDTIVSVVQCGGYGVERETVNSSIAALKPLVESHYRASGGTPLWDSVGDLIEQFEATPDANDTNVSFLVMAITDGEENGSYRYTTRSLMEKIKKLQATDRWTFVFRVPKGYARSLASQGIPAGNILEWEQSDRGMQASTQATSSAFAGYYQAMAKGVRATDKFYTNVASISQTELKAALIDISSQVNVWNVPVTVAIKPFCEAQLNGQAMAKGGAFYQLTKTEDEVQDYKQIAIRDKNTGAVYSGAAARDMLGLPQYGMARVAPGDHGGYDVYIQSTSINRKLPAGTTLLYWPYAGVTK